MGTGYCPLYIHHSRKPVGLPSYGFSLLELDAIKDYALIFKRANRALFAGGKMGHRSAKTAPNRFLQVVDSETAR